ncbi:16513_t:CDS:2 [Funneliformis mosseae]|uniref:16513_t:CDS:1 n=1 Tax=Funneliformis mosseae TaxID=27381 RepID=A0A9N9FHP7_FUNMO|nr:16513_t:CDS:2 [Funneliformis mosseae]
MFVQKKTYHKLKNENLNCQTNLENLQNDLEISQTELDNLRKKIENSQKQIEYLRENSENLHENSQIEINHHRKEFEQLRENSQSEINKLQNENNHKNEIIKILKSKLDKALEELFEIKAKELRILETERNAVMKDQGNFDHGNIEIIEDSNHTECGAGLDKIMKENVDDNDIHSISSNSDTVDDIDGDWDLKAIADKYIDE